MAGIVACRRTFPLIFAFYALDCAGPVGDLQLQALAQHQRVGAQIVPGFELRHTDPMALRQYRQVVAPAHLDVHAAGWWCF